jgi:hypothetical protein
MTNTELLKALPVAARNDGRAGIAGANAATRPVAAAADSDAWAGVKTVLEVGFAIVRVVELAILFA